MFETWSLPSTLTPTIWQKLHKPGCFNFSSGFDVFYLIFHLSNFLIALINWMIGSSHSQLCKKNSCSVKLPRGLLDHKPRKIPMEDSWTIILHNKSKYLLLNDKQMPHKILFSLLDEIQNIIKVNARESKGNLKEVT